MVSKNVYWKSLSLDVRVSLAVTRQDFVQSHYIAHLEDGDAVVNWQHGERVEAQRFLDSRIGK